MSKPDVETAILKIRSAESIVDLVHTLKLTGDLENLKEDTLFYALTVAMDLMSEAQDAIEGVTA